MFCAAIPMTLSIATVTRGKINERKQKTVLEQTNLSLNAPILRLPVERISAVVVTGLVVGSVLVHTGTVSRFGL
jgi:hypothetical protein